MGTCLHKCKHGTVAGDANLGECPIPYWLDKTKKALPVTSYHGQRHGENAGRVAGLIGGRDRCIGFRGRLIGKRELTVFPPDA